MIIPADDYHPPLTPTPQKYKRETSANSSLTKL
jgi:hypothetical protein